MDNSQHWQRNRLCLHYVFLPSRSPCNTKLTPVKILITMLKVQTISLLILDLRMRCLRLFPCCVNFLSEFVSSIFKLCKMHILPSDAGQPLPISCASYPAMTLYCFNQLCKIIRWLKEGMPRCNVFKIIPLYVWENMREVLDSWDLHNIFLWNYLLRIKNLTI